MSLKRPAEEDRGTTRDMLFMMVSRFRTGVFLKEASEDSEALEDSESSSESDSVPLLGDEERLLVADAGTTGKPFDLSSMA